MAKLTKYWPILFALLASCFDQSLSAESACADWASYKDEKCFKVVDDTLRTFDEAEKACAKLENSPTLAIIHSQEEQDFLVNYLFRTLKKVDNVWVGAKYNNNAFHWVDNSALTYSNWDAKGPHKKVDYCVEMLSDESTLGKWIDGPCERKNAFVCQKAQTWSMARLQETLLETRKQLTDALEVANKKIANQKHEFDDEKKKTEDALGEANKKITEQRNEIVILKQNPIPIGFIYTQLSNELPPNSIWPGMTWSDVSSSYAGVFFRVEGGGSEALGKTQAENAPRVVQIERIKSSLSDDLLNIPLNVGERSNFIYTGDVVTNSVPNVWVHDIGLLFITSSGEVRPRNMAIRVWKRTG